MDRLEGVLTQVYASGAEVTHAATVRTRSRLGAQVSWSIRRSFSEGEAGELPHGQGGPGARMSILSRQFRLASAGTFTGGTRPAGLSRSQHVAAR